MRYHTTAEIISAWRKRQLTSNGLMQLLAEHFTPFLVDVDASGVFDPKKVHGMCIRTLDRARNNGNADSLTTPEALAEYARDEVVRRMLARSERRARGQIAAAFKELETLERLYGDEVDRTSLIVPFTPPPLELPEDESGLAFLANTATRLAADQKAVARLLVLRLFGGWSIRDVALHDGKTEAQVTAEWQSARAFMATNAADESASAFGRIVTLDVCDYSVLAALNRHPELLRTVHWRAFEKILAAVLEELGYEVELQQGTKDGGIDIFAIRRHLPLGIHRYLIQAKRWNHAVGVEPVRELLFLRHHYRVTKACLATTSHFTRGAWQLAHEYPWELELRDFAKLKDWLDLAVNGNPLHE